MKRIYGIFALLIIASLILSGCEKTISGVKNKFIKKKKEQQQERVINFYDENEEYTQEFPNITMYQNHYIYWKRNTEELMESLRGDNLKRQKQYAERALQELVYMQSFLVKEKQMFMEEDVIALRRIASDIRLGRGGSISASKGMIQDVERHLYGVMRRFSPKKVKYYIAEDVIPEINRNKGTEDDNYGIYY